MKILFILILIFAAFVFGANAQECGQFTTTLVVKTEDNKPVENSVVQLVPLGKDETKNKTFVRDESDRSKFSVTFNEGHLILGKYKVIVSADGFETSEKEIGFPHCKHQYFEFNLKAGRAFLPRETLLTGIVYDLGNSTVPDVKISAVEKKSGKAIKSVSNPDGVYTILLSEGVYNIEFFREGFRVTKIEGYKVGVKGKLRLDITLDLGEQKPDFNLPDENKKPK